MSPTAILHRRLCGTAAWSSLAVQGEVYPGWCMAGWLGGAIPVPHPVPSWDPYSVIFRLRALPTAK